MPVIFCKKCREGFEPDLRTRGPWICPRCKATNANLRRHYRSIGDLFVLGLLLFGAAWWFGGRNWGLTAATALICADVLLLIVTAVAIFRSKAPWANAGVRFLIWAVFLVACSFNVGLPLLRGRIFVAGVIVYAILFSYLFWLHWTTKRALAGSVPANVIEVEADL
jgi:hypothetical protein